MCTLPVNDVYPPRERCVPSSVNDVYPYALVIHR